MQVAPRALNQIARLDLVARRRVEAFLVNGIDRDNPRSLGRPLVASPFWRYRVGDYRILAAIEDCRLIVLVVGAEHRRSVYQRR